MTLYVVRDCLPYVLLAGIRVCVAVDRIASPSYIRSMAPRPRWWHQLQASKNEALLAVDLYNRSGNERQLEAFVVHMAMAWLKLLQARAYRDGDDMYVRDRKNRRQRSRDGDWVLKSLVTVAEEYMDATDPRLVNLKFFIVLRNRIEHRHEGDIAALVSGRTQAWILNYEETLVGLFGTEESLSSQLRFPLFLSSITTDAVDALKAVRRRVPKGILDWLQDFDASLEPDIGQSQRFDFRIFLIPHTGSKTEADAAMTFVRLEDLTDEQRSVMAEAQTIIRDRQVPVSDLGALLPKQIAVMVSEGLGRPFNLSQHTLAWRYYGVRPPGGAPDPTKTKSDFCRYNPAFGRYVYTEAWAAFLVRKLADEGTYNAVLSGNAPAPEV